MNTRSLQNFPMNYRIAASLVAAALLNPLSISAAFSQTYPSKAARIIVPFPAGGAVDQLARTLAQRMSTGWGHPVIVENRAGGGGIIGTDVVAKAAPGG
ncbi:MAG: Bug family tripartite tricarboxylate transporter substrate binding protein [Burkholderiales bacterium]